MDFKANIIPYTLQFKNPAGTSRGVYSQHKVWYVVLRSKTDITHFGIGECAPLPDLSCDALPDAKYMEILQSTCDSLEEKGELDYDSLRPYPSIFFGLETALKHYRKKSLSFWDTPFSRGEAGIAINGLIWMGDFDAMFRQIESKLEQGFNCIKLKIGAIDFEQELNLLKHIRSHFSADRVTLRVDANGAFSTVEAYSKLMRLSEFDLHSIEQPIAAGNWREMAELAKNTPLPIALDEELIGCNDFEKKDLLLKIIHPQYIILKPSLHGGWRGCKEWIEIAEKYHIGWWVTSALESNIGLNAIAQWCAELGNPLPQGLGTGMLYTNNIDLPLVIKKDRLWFDADKCSTDRLKNSLSFFNV